QGFSIGDDAPVSPLVATRGSRLSGESRRPGVGGPGERRGRVSLADVPERAGSLCRPAYRTSYSPVRVPSGWRGRAPPGKVGGGALFDLLGLDDLCAAQFAQGR